MKRFSVYGLIVCIATLAWAHPSQQSGDANQTYLYLNVDISNGTRTQVRGINESGTMVGIYSDDVTQLIRGFSLENGTFALIDYPGAAQTYPRDINNRGQIVGYFIDTAGTFHGFLLDGGNFQQIDYPGALATNMRSINDLGLIAGDYTDATRQHGLVLRNGAFTTFDFPGASDTGAYGIDNANNIVGSYSTDGGVTRYGYLLHARKFTAYNVPGATTTEFFGMNDRAQFPGYFYDAAGNNHPLLLDRGRVVEVAPPGASFALDRCVNNSGFVGGNYSDSTGTHGFIAIPIR